MNAQLGAERVDVLARRPEACDGIVATAKAIGVAARVIPWTDSDVDLSHELVISTVPVGAADAISHAVPSQPGILLDVVYQSWPTPLARAWQAQKGRSASGLEMLLHQGIEQVALMTGHHVAPAAIRPRLTSALADAAST